MNSPVITIDGPSGVGKGTISALLAEHLSWNYLDSGALYRITGYAAVLRNISLDDEEKISHLAASLAIKFKTNGEILLDDKDISSFIRTEQAGMDASKIAAYPSLRKALLSKQHNFLKAPGLIADGRDMGTTIFPQAEHKFYLTASAEERGKRRYKQLIDKESCASITASNSTSSTSSSSSSSQALDLAEIIREIEERDHRDMTRSSSPLKAADNANIIDTSLLSIDEVFEKIVQLIGR